MLFYVTILVNEPVTSYTFFFSPLIPPEGHRAKYGSYTMMNLDDNKVLDIQLIQVKRIFTIALQ